MLTDYIEAALRRATFEVLTDDQTVYAEIPALRGVWANAATREECEAELRSALEDWLLFSLVNGFEIPILDGIDLNLARVS